MPDVWNLLIINPMVNGLLFLYHVLFNNFTLSLAVFTLLIRVITFPLTLQQMRSTKKMTELQQSDAFKKMQEKYAKDKEKLGQETMKLYQAAGVNPLGGCLPTVIQFPILIGLYQAINLAMAASPVQLLALSKHLYPFLPNVTSLIPIDNRFLWLNLGLPDPYFIITVLVVATTWIQSKVMTPPSADPQAAQMSQSMAVTMPLMIGWMSLQFPSGLSIYWIIGNILSIVQYAVTPGTKINWKKVLSFNSAPAPVPAKAQKKR
jgi:YidC/Oxa1 family membrane protein insertase